MAWVEHPLYFLNDKYDSLNLWHALEDVTHAFEAYALKGWGSEAQVGVAGVEPGNCELKQSQLVGRQLMNGEVFLSPPRSSHASLHCPPALPGGCI